MQAVRFRRNIVSGSSGPPRRVVSVKRSSEIVGRGPATLGITTSLLLAIFLLFLLVLTPSSPPCLDLVGSPQSTRCPPQLPSTLLLYRPRGYISGSHLAFPCKALYPCIRHISPKPPSPFSYLSFRQSILCQHNTQRRVDSRRNGRLAQRHPSAVHLGGPRARGHSSSRAELDLGPTPGADCVCAKASET